MKRVSIVGLGYIGLPTAIVAAEQGFEVYGYDVDKNKVETIESGHSPIVETGITSKLRRVLSARTLQVSTTLEPADCFVIAVPTPITREKTVCLDYVFDAVRAIAAVLKKGDLVIVESTISVGATEKVAALLEKKTSLVRSQDFFVAHCPERILPGNMFHELVHNSRVIGGMCDEATERATFFYKKFVRGTVFAATHTEAELTKLIENSYRDVNIAFAHQVAEISRAAGADHFRVIELANKHPRVSILKPGAGVGGHCLAVDPWFLVESFPQATTLLKEARTINDRRPYQVADYIVKDIDTKYPDASEVRVAVLGVTYKPNVDDMRNSPACLVAQQLGSHERVRLVVHDPYVDDGILTKDYSLDPVTLDEALASDVLVILVGHRDFLALRNKDVRHLNIIDVAGLFDEHGSEQKKGRFQGAWNAWGSVLHDESTKELITNLKTR